MQHQQEQLRTDNVVLVRADQRKRRVIPGATSQYEDLSPAGVRSLAMFSMTVAPGKSTAETLKHGGDECFLLLSGKHEVDVEGKRFTLEPGDTIFIPRGQRHRGWNEGDEMVDSIFVLSPPEYVEQEKPSAQPKQEARVIRASERKRWSAPSGATAVYEQLSPPGLASMVLMEVRAEPGQASADALRHAGDENLVCLAGRIEYDVEGTKYTLGRGDSIYIPRGRRHRVMNPGSEPARGVFVICPARYES